MVTVPACESPKAQNLMAFDMCVSISIYVYIYIEIDTMYVNVCMHACIHIYIYHPTCLFLSGMEGSGGYAESWDARCAQGA